MKIPIPGVSILGPGGSNLRLDEPLGGGAFGDVFKAVEENNGKIFAVKFPRLAFGGEKELSAFFNEIQAAEAINHTNVVRVIHVEINPAQLPPYLVMEFVAGGTLKMRLDDIRSSGDYPPANLIQRWATGLINGISAINERMLHRDLKPDNILMEGNSPKIGDFGLSKIVDAATRTRTFKGGQHILYMAPEGWRLETNKIQIDMYSMGIIFFEIAALQYPYELPAVHFNIDAVREMHLYQRPISLEELRPDLPVAYCHLVSKLLEKNPQARFSNWSEVSKALEKALSQSRTEATSSHSLVAALLDETGRIHLERTQQQLEEEKRLASEREQRQLDEYQKDKLIEIIRERINEFNDQSVLGKIEENPKQFGSFAGVEYHLPFDGVINLIFSRINPLLNLSLGQVRFAAYLGELGEGCGLNYLLCRKDDSDLYGVWVACMVRQNAWTKNIQRPEPFGFSGPEIQEIEDADKSIHIYKVEFSDDLADAFVNIILNVMRRNKN